MNLLLAMQKVAEDNDGANIGVGVGGLLVVVLLVLAIVYFVRRN